MTPENSIYYIVAYVAAAAVYGGYILSLLIRARRVRERHRRQSRASGRSAASM